MRLIDNYLAEVAGYLPRDHREDIEAELKSSLYEQLEDRSEHLGRELTEQEQAEFLKKLGHPIRVAAEYAPQRYLIGPTVFPFYVQTLKTLAVVLILFHVVLSLTIAATSLDWSIVTDHTVSRILSSVVLMFAYVTLGFAVAERSGHTFNWTEKWDPLKLRDRHEYLSADRGDLVFDVISSFFVLLWWIGAIVLPTQVSWVDASLTIIRAPVWHSVYLPVAVVLAGSIAVNGYVLGVGRWGRFSLLLRMALDVATIGIVLYLVRAPELVSFEITGSLALDRAQEGVTVAVRVFLWIVLAFAAVDIWKLGRKSFRLAQRGV